jgi:SAM-dependent methyltransferase
MQALITVPDDWRRPGRSISYTVVWCDACGFGRLVPSPDEQAIRDAYDIPEYYTHQGETQTMESTPGLLDRLRVHVAWRGDRGTDVDLAWFERHFGREVQEVCDLGCGSGDLLRSLQNVGHSVAGVEPDDDARKLAAARGIKVFNGTAEHLPEEIANRKFDRVFMIHSLEHCGDPIVAFANAARILAPRGTLIIETPNNAALGLKWARSTWHWLDVPRHLNFFTRKSLEQLCWSSKLKVEQIEFRGYTRQFKNDWIRVEQRIWDSFRRAAPEIDMPPRNSAWRAWRLLSRTMLARPEKKYDSVRLLASA